MTGATTDTDRRLRFTRAEWSGAIGDLGTTLPLAFALVAINGFPTARIFLLWGLVYVATGLYFLVGIFDLWNLGWSGAWPIFVIAAGLGFILHRHEDYRPELQGPDVVRLGFVFLSVPCVEQVPKVLDRLRPFLPLNLLFGQPLFAVLVVIGELALFLF